MSEAAFAREHIDVLNNKLPLWYQVAQSLRAEIMGRRRDASLRLPTELQIAQQYGVSVVTVRQALKSIEAEGLISRRRRTGTFVNLEALPRRPLKLLGAIEAVFAQQTSEEAELLEKRHVPVPQSLLQYFPDLAEVVLFRRLRKDQGNPVSYAMNYVRPEYGKRITRRQLRTQPMTRVLRDEFGVRVSRIEDTVEARLASPEIAHILQMDLMTPVLFFTGVTIDERDDVVDVACIHYRGDRYKFSVGFDLDVQRSGAIVSAVKSATKRHI